MHGQSHHVVDGAGEGVAAEEPGLPVRVLKKVDGDKLDHNRCENLPLGQGTVPKELLYFRVGGNYLVPSRSMRLLGVIIPEGYGDWVREGFVIVKGS